MPPQAKRWQIAPPLPPEHRARFRDLHPLVVQILYNRGITTPAEAIAFLDGQVADDNPFRLKGMIPAITRLRQALRAGEPIAVYGDFDADGVTATALLVHTLRELGGNARPYIPHRVDEGYGLNNDALTGLAADGVRVVVTVDCGVRSVAEVAHANRLGLDLIITDHHSVGVRIPDALAVINPRQFDCPYPHKDLAGVGLAYKLAQALLRSHAQVPVTNRPVRLAEEDLLDLVALGTVADLAPLLGENRALVHRGLKRINAMKRLGVEALMRRAGYQPGDVDTTAIGYGLGPRLNAAGRLADAMTAYDLLLAQYPGEAERLAEELDALNRERQQLTVETLERAREMALADDPGAPLLFAAAPDFLAGIVGLVAGRLSEEFYRPAVVVELGQEESKGSCRSIPEFHITHALDACADLLVRHGGHAAAAGFTVCNENLSGLVERLRAQAAEQLADVELIPVLSVDAEVSLQELNWALQAELARLEPCGYANPTPLFVSRNVQVRGGWAVGAEGKHLKLKLTDGRVTWDGIAFRQGEWADKLPDRLDIAYHLEANEWNGEPRLQLNVQDIRPAE